MRYLNLSLAAVFLAAFALFFGNPVLAQDAPLKVGFFDINKALSESKKGKAAASKLEAKHDSLKKSLEAKAKDLEKKKQDLEKQAPTMNQEAFEKRRGELAKEINTHLEQTQKAAEEMNNASKEAMEPLIRKVEEAVGQIAKQRGYTMVLEIKEAGVVFFSKDADITSQVTEAIDK
ncbi:MAG: OmpH family outer membrane protein [Deltaproteobacteria bacterium]|jgi:outer membrane protein|nr:OmpH family outer membrane protein [Deltaproteobacteria bacterium]